jgi:hypothetical protein
MLGVALGITAGDLLTSVIGIGVWQLAVIVGLAMAAAISLGAGLLLLSEAGVSATLVATLQSTARGFLPPDCSTFSSVGRWRSSSASCCSRCTRSSWFAPRPRRW